MVAKGAPAIVNAHRDKELGEAIYNLAQLRELHDETKAESSAALAKERADASAALSAALAKERADASAALAAAVESAVAAERSKATTVIASPKASTTNSDIDAPISTATAELVPSEQSTTDE